MTLQEFANVDSFYRDLDSGKELKYHEYMNRIIIHLGLENIKPYIPYSISFLKGKLKEDIHLNNTSISNWDRAAGFIDRGSRFIAMHDGITNLFRRNGITSYSCAEGVCILKEAARILIEMEGSNE